MVNAPHIPDWLVRQYPFAPESITTATGARLSFIDAGPRSEVAVMMLHGNPTWSYYFRHLIADLAPHRRCLVPDHVGMGLSEKPQHYNYTLATRIADVERLVASRGVKQVDLVVHDWGGAIGFGFAARQPDRIGRMVILNTAAFAADRIPLRIAACKLPLFGPLIVRGANGFAWPATWMAMHRRPLSGVEKRAYLWPYDSWANRVAVNAFVRDIPLGPSHRSWTALKSVEQGLERFRNHAALVVWGGRDFCFNDHFLQRWQEILPQADVHRIADAGHYVLEDARDEAGALVTRFLQAAS